jgi:hypothetical protein
MLWRRRGSSIVVIIMVVDIRRTISGMIIVVWSCRDIWRRSARRRGIELVLTGKRVRRLLRLLRRRIIVWMVRIILLAWISHFGDNQHNCNTNEDKEIEKKLAMRTTGRADKKDERDDLLGGTSRSVRDRKGRRSTGTQAYDVNRQI